MLKIFVIPLKESMLYYQIVLTDGDYRRVLSPNYVCELLNNCAKHIGVEAENLYECVDCGDSEDG